ncbi:MAG: hypothetical protein IPO91_02405 [Chloroflexi bacterium]|nr:hypothetical protein [Chloroflexota bacterium]
MSGGDGGIASELLKMGFNFVARDNQTPQRIGWIMPSGIRTVHSFLNQLLDRGHNSLKLIQQERSPQSRPFSGSTNLFAPTQTAP